MPGATRQMGVSRGIAVIVVVVVAVFVVVVVVADADAEREVDKLGEVSSISGVELAVVDVVTPVVREESVLKFSAVAVDPASVTVSTSVVPFVIAVAVGGIVDDVTVVVFAVVVAFVLDDVTVVVGGKVLVDVDVVVVAVVVAVAAEVVVEFEGADDTLVTLVVVVI